MGIRYKSEQYRKGGNPNTINDIVQRNTDRLMDIANNVENRLNQIETNIGSEVVTDMAIKINTNQSDSQERSLMMGYE